MVLRQTLWTTAAGIAIGTALGLGATILLRSEFYGVGPVELIVLLPVAAAMEAVCLIVSLPICLPSLGSLSIQWKPYVTPESYLAIPDARR